MGGAGGCPVPGHCPWLAAWLLAPQKVFGVNHLRDAFWRTKPLPFVLPFLSRSTLHSPGNMLSLPFHTRGSKSGRGIVLSQGVQGDHDGGAQSLPLKSLLAQTVQEKGHIDTWRKGAERLGLSGTRSIRE